MRSFTVSVAVVSAILATSVGAEGSEKLWGSSYLTPDYYSGAQIWTVDVSNGAVNVLKSYSPTVDKIGGYGIKGFGDIAQAANGYLYTTVLTEGTQSFDLLAKINPQTGAILNSWDVCGTYSYSHGMNGSSATATINSLKAVGNTLYGIEGGGVNHASLVTIALDANGDFVSRADKGDAGDMSDGDLAIHPSTGAWYGTFWTSTGSTLDTINPITGDGTTGPNTGLTAAMGNGTVAGLEFTSDGTLWAGSWGDRKLYSINSLTTGGNTVQFDLSVGDEIGGNMTGLSNIIPEPGTLALLVTAGLGALAYAWRRRRS